MAELFYGKMGLPIRVRNTSKDGKSARDLFELEGAPSTNENALRTWMTEVPQDSWQYRVLDCALILRGINTRRSLYYTPYPLWRSPVDGRIHPQIKNCGTVTRRHRDRQHRRWPARRSPARRPARKSVKTR